MARKNQILIIDDDSAMCLLLQKILESDYDVITKDNGMSAMYWLIEGNMPDLIITDLDMPNLNGEEFISKLRSSGYYKDLPFIVITGYNCKEERLKIMKLGVHDYFLKPFAPKDLLFSVDIAIKHSLQKSLV